MLRRLADVPAWGGSGVGCVPACCCHRAKAFCWDPNSALGAHPQVMVLSCCGSAMLAGIMLLGEHNIFIMRGGWDARGGGQGWGV